MEADKYDNCLLLVLKHPFLKKPKQIHYHPAHRFSLPHRNSIQRIDAIKIFGQNIERKKSNEKKNRR